MTDIPVNQTEQPSPYNVIRETINTYVPTGFRDDDGVWHDGALRRDALAALETLTEVLRQIEHWPDDVGHSPERDLQKIRHLAGSALDATEQKPAVECDGGPYCGATRHLHGCFNDKGNCDHPSEHRIVAADATEQTNNDN